MIVQRRGATEHARIGALEDDPVLFAGDGNLNFGALLALGEERCEMDGFLLGEIAGEEWPLGLAIEVDPPFVAGVDDDEDGRGHECSIVLTPRVTG